MTTLLISFMTGLMQIVRIAAQPLAVVVNILSSLFRLLLSLAFSDPLSFVDGVVVLYAIARVIQNTSGLISQTHARPSLGDIVTAVFGWISSLIGLLDWRKYVVIVARIILRSTLAVAWLTLLLVWKWIVPEVWSCGSAFYETVVLSKSTCSYWTHVLYKTSQVRLVPWLKKTALESSAVLELVLFGEWVFEDEVGDAGVRKSKRATGKRKGGNIRRLGVKWSRRHFQSRREDEQLSEYDDALEQLPGSTVQPTSSTTPIQPTSPPLPLSSPLAPAAQVSDISSDSAHNSGCPPSPILDSCFILRTQSPAQPTLTTEPDSIVLLIAAMKTMSLVADENEADQQPKPRRVKEKARMTVFQPPTSYVVPRVDPLLELVSAMKAMKIGQGEKDQATETRPTRRAGMIAMFEVRSHPNVGHSQADVVGRPDSSLINSPVVPNLASPALDVDQSFDENYSSQDVTADTSVDTPPAPATPAPSIEPLPAVAGEGAICEPNELSGFEPKPPAYSEDLGSVDEPELGADPCSPLELDERIGSNDTSESNLAAIPALTDSSSSPSYPDAFGPALLAASTGIMDQEPPANSGLTSELESEPRPVRKLSNGKLKSALNPASLLYAPRSSPEATIGGLECTGSTEKSKPDAQDQTRNGWETTEDVPEETMRPTIDDAEVNQPKQNANLVGDTFYSFGDAGFPFNNTIGGPTCLNFGASTEAGPTGFEYAYGGQPDDFGGPLMPVGLAQPGSSNLFPSTEPFSPTFDITQTTLTDPFLPYYSGLPTSDTSGLGLMAGPDPNYLTPFDLFLAGSSSPPLDLPGSGMDTDDVLSGSGASGSSWFDKSKWPAHDVNEVQRGLERAGVPPMGTNGIDLGVSPGVGSWMAGGETGAGSMQGAWENGGDVMDGAMPGGTTDSGVMANNMAGCWSNPMVDGNLPGAAHYPTLAPTAPALGTPFDFLNELPPANFELSNEQLLALANAPDFAGALNALGNPIGDAVPQPLPAMGYDQSLLDMLSDYPPMPLITDEELEALVSAPEFIAALEGFKDDNGLTGPAWGVSGNQGGVGGNGMGGGVSGNVDVSEPRKITGRIAGRERRAKRVA